MSKKPQKVDFYLSQRHIVIQRWYDALGAFNDFVIAIWFLIGSVLFLSDSLKESGTWLFIAGSAQFLLRPTLKLASLIHIYRACKNTDNQEQNN